MLRLAIVSLVVLASPAGATPLAFSATDVTWTTDGRNGVRSTLSLHLDDAGHPSPGIGQIRLTVTGHVEQPNFRHRYLEVVGMEIYGDYGASSLEIALLEAQFTHPRATAASASPTIAGPGTPTYAWLDFQTGITGRELAWSATALLTVHGVEERPMSVDFRSHYVTVSCRGRGRCDRDLLTAGNLDVQVTSAAPSSDSLARASRSVNVPEPGTGLLVLAGLLGFAGWRGATR